MAEILQGLATRLAVPGLPDWTGLVVLLVLGLALLAFLAMPFSVFGVKARLDQIEAQLDEIQTELRAFVLRHEAMPRRRMQTDEDWVEPPAAPLRAAEPLRAKPPVPPPAAWAPENRASRVEPRLDRPREG